MSRADNQKTEREPAVPDLEVPKRNPKDRVLVKVQLPLMSTETDPPALVYSEDRKRVLEYIHASRAKQKLRPGEVKAFFYAYVSGHDVELDERAPKQDYNW